MQRKILLILSVCAFLVMGVSSVFAQEFSADMVSRMGKQTMTAKIFVAKDKIRMEMPGSIMIIRSDKKVSWMIMPSEKMYMEQPIDMSKAPKTAKEFAGELERTSLGMETINGQQTEKFQVTYTEDKKTMSVYQWIKDGQIPVKVEAVDGSWSMEYQNLKVGPPPADLFEPPAGYEKMAMPSIGDLMKGMIR